MALAELAGRGLDGAVVADVGAGTGIAARQMRDRGAEVIAVEPSEGMLAELAQASPGVHGVRGNGNALPLGDRCADFVTYAQAWHWTDPRRAVPEYRRVLRSGGTFAAWWNLTARQAPWEVAQETRLLAACASYRAAGTDIQLPPGLRRARGLVVASPPEGRRVRLVAAGSARRPPGQSQLQVVRRGPRPRRTRANSSPPSARRSSLSSRTGWSRRTTGRCSRSCAPDHSGRFWRRYSVIGNTRWPDGPLATDGTPRTPATTIARAAGTQALASVTSACRPQMASDLRNPGAGWAWPWTTEPEKTPTGR